MNECMSSFSGMVSGELSEGLNQLKSEHPPLLKDLENLYSLVQIIEGNPALENSFLDLIDKVSAFLAELEPHSIREEEVLFPMMGTYIGTSSGPIAVMEYEHDQAKKLIGTFLEKTTVEKVFKTTEVLELAGLIKQAYFILTEHFSKEENVLFPMAERMLSIEEKAELLHKIRESM
ncbi:MAG: hemerythrin domain-containing protein [Bacillota bacterium]|nr:hemerythrin domain-containing protein [Bacillota bacterium]